MSQKYKYVLWQDANLEHTKNNLSFIAKDYFYLLKYKSVFILKINNLAFIKIQIIIKGTDFFIKPQALVQFFGMRLLCFQKVQSILLSFVQSGYITELCLTLFETKACFRNYTLSWRSNVVNEAIFQLNQRAEM